MKKKKKVKSETCSCVPSGQDGGRNPIRGGGGGGGGWNMMVPIGDSKRREV